MIEYLSRDAQFGRLYIASYYSVISNTELVRAAPDPTFKPIFKR